MNNRALFDVGNRRFLVSGADFLSKRRGILIVEGYLWTRDDYHIRVSRKFSYRHEAADYEEMPSLLILRRSRRSLLEWAIEIEKNAAADLLLRTPWKTVKTRYAVTANGHAWHVDVFHLQNSGLTVAECSDPHSGDSNVLPIWCDVEVTGDHRYDDVSLAKKTWPG